MNLHEKRMRANLDCIQGLLGVDMDIILSSKVYNPFKKEVHFYGTYVKDEQGNPITVTIKRDCYERLELAKSLDQVIEIYKTSVFHVQEDKVSDPDRGV